MKNLLKIIFSFCVFIYALAIVSSCGGGGGGGSSSGAQGATVKPVSNVNSSNKTSYGFSENSPIIVSADNGASTLETPVFLKNVEVQSTKVNTRAKGDGIYSEALEQMGIVQINLTITIDGVTTEYTLGPNDALVLNQVAPGTKVVISGKVQTKEGEYEILQKESSTEAFQDSLPLFVEYKATLKNNLGKDVKSFVYSTDKPIELPILNDITVNVAGDAVVLRHFWAGKLAHRDFL